MAYGPLITVLALALLITVAVPGSGQLLYPHPTRSPLTAAPRKCRGITAQVLRSPRFDTIYRIRAYRGWLHQHGLDGAYHFHRRFLRHRDAQRRSASHWVSKSPDHVFAPDALRRTCPDAVIVMPHRDPLCVLACVAELTEILRRPFTPHIGRVQIGAEISERWAEGADRMVAAGASGAQIPHLHYHDLVRAPMDTLSALYDHCGKRLNAEAEARTAESLRAPPRGGYAVHAHRLESFGLEAAALRARLAGYMQTLDDRPQRTRTHSALAWAAGTA
jgi:hypothetical protein